MGFAGGCLSFGDPGGRLHLLYAGVHFTGDRVRGDRLHNQLFTLADHPSGWGLEATGTVEELADRSARWFRTVLDKPVVLYVWLNADRYAYAARFAFADDDQTIRRSARYTARIQPRRGSRRSWAVLPSGARALTRRGALTGCWYE